MMDPELKAQWIAALRSGNYAQAKNALVDIDPIGNVSYCCLGVLCKLRGMGDRDMRVLSKQTGGMGYACTIIDDNGDLIDEEAGEELGLNKDTRADLAAYNDGRKGTHWVEPWSFAQIADHLEKSKDI